MTNLIETIRDEFSEEDLNEVEMINPQYGDPVEFESVEELAATIIELCRDNGWELPARLHEGTDYRYTWKQRAIDALCDGDYLGRIGYTGDETDEVDAAVNELEKPGSDYYDIPAL